MLNTRSFPLQRRSIGAARAFVRDSLSAVRTDCVAAELLVSELATNAVEHAGSPFSISVEIRRSVVRIEVTNDAPELLAVVTARPSERGGFGLQLVDKLSQQWGTESSQQRKVVWFELART